MSLGRSLNAGWRARFAFCAALLMLVSAADGFFCGAEASAVAISDVTHGTPDDGAGADGDCAHGHCHHAIPLAAVMQTLTEHKNDLQAHAWLTVAPRSAYPPTLERPPKA